jgi:hypothetical protein
VKRRPLAALAVLACVGSPPVPCTVCGNQCVSLDTDSDNCGACGNGCGPGQVCLGGSCQLTCPTGWFQCPDACANLSWDAQHCGDCSTVCDPQSACVGGTCTRGCIDPEQVCDGLCVDPSTSRAHCGGCDLPCAPGQVCSQGACVESCAVGLSTCAADGGAFCTDLDSDDGNCGACGHACGAVQRCASGLCRNVVSTPQSCAELDAGAAPFFTQLYLGGALSRPFTAVCGADGGTYLSLLHLEPQANFARFAAGGAFTGSDVVSRYAAVRFERVDAGQYAVLTTDRAFAQTTGQADRPGNPSVTQVDYGSAADCVAASSMSGTGNVDLRGTPFVVEGAFAVAGFMAAGTTTYSPTRQVVDLTGGGFCGGNSVVNGQLMVRYCAPPLNDGGLCP